MKRSNHKNIYIIEPDLALLDMMERRLAIEAYLHVVGSTIIGREAINKVKACRPDIVMIGNPIYDADGVEIFQQLKEQVPYIVVILAAKDDMLAAWFLENGAYEVISKPFQMEKVIKILEDIENPALAGLKGEKVTMDNQQNPNGNEFYGGYHPAGEGTPQMPNQGMNQMDFYQNSQGYGMPEQQGYMAQQNDMPPFPQSVPAGQENHQMQGMPQSGNPAYQMPGEGYAPAGSQIPQGMPQPGVAPQGMAPQGMPQPGMNPQSMPQGMGMPQMGMSPQGMPQGMLQPGMAPQGMPQPGMNSQGMYGAGPQGAMPNNTYGGISAPPMPGSAEQPQRFNFNQEKNANDGTVSFRQVVLTVNSPKGGVGKTTLTKELSSYFASIKVNGQKLKVCAVDCDFEYGDLAGMLGLKQFPSIQDWIDDIKDKERAMGSVEGLVYSPQEIDEYLLTHESGLKVLAAPANTSKALEITADYLKVVLNSLKACDFDIIVLDTSPNTNDCTTVALYQATKIIEITTLDIASIDDVKSLLSMLKQVKFDMSKIELILNKMPANNVDLDVGEISQLLEYDIKRKIPQWDKIRHVNNDGKSALLTKDSDFSKMVRLIANDVIPLHPDESEISGKKKSGGFFGSLFGKK